LYGYTKYFSSLRHDLGDDKKKGYMKKQSTDDMTKDPTTTAPALAAYGPEDLFLPQREPESDFDDEFLEQLELRETNLSEWEIREIEMRRELGLPEYEPREKELTRDGLYGTDKGMALSAMECDYIIYLGYCRSDLDILQAWQEFYKATAGYAKCDVDDVIKSAADEFREQDPIFWETCRESDLKMIRALREEYLLHYWLRRCACPAGARHVTDPSWVDEEAALHRQGQCRFDGPKIPWPWLTPPAEKK
jgi:hypothetical protein